MKHTIRRAIQLFAIALMLPLWPVGDAGADPQYAGALRGDYDVTIQRDCDLPNGTGIDPQHITVQGRFRFDGSSTTQEVTFTGQFLFPSPSGGPPMTGIPTGVSTEEVYFIGGTIGPVTPCSGTYSVETDGTFTGTFATCSFIFTVGSNNGQPGTLSNLKIHGKLAHDATILLIGNTTAATAEVESVDCNTCGTGLHFRRLCTSSGTATARR